MSTRDAAFEGRERKESECIGDLKAERSDRMDHAGAPPSDVMHAQVMVKDHQQKQIQEKRTTRS